MILQFFINILSYFFYLLPKPLFYGISNCIAWILCYIIQYRKKVIEENLHKAFPQYSKKQIEIIKKQFYINLTHQFFEMLIMGANSYHFIEKNYEIDVHPLNKLYEEGKSVLMVLGHQFNWEWGLWILSKKTLFHVQGVYMPIKNKALDEWIRNVRGKFGAEMVPANQVRSLLKPPTHRPTLTLIIGDQSPANLDHCYWTEFLNQETAFINSYEKIAQRRKMAVVFIEVIKKNTGNYATPYQIFCNDASQLKENEIIENFAKFLEKSINTYPSNWLWSHRRWKHKKTKTP